MYVLEPSYLLNVAQVCNPSVISTFIARVQDIQHITQFLQMDRVLLFHDIDAYAVDRSRNPFTTVKLTFRATTSTSVEFGDPQTMLISDSSSC